MVGMVDEGLLDLLLRRIDYVGNPIHRQRDPVINPRLSSLSARVTSRHDADQVPTASLLQHQRSARIALQTKHNSIFSVIVLE